MLGKTELKRLFHEITSERPELKQIKDFDRLLIQVHFYMMDYYGSNNKDESKEIALCIFNDYAFLYR